MEDRILVLSYSTKYVIITFKPSLISVGFSKYFTIVVIYNTIVIYNF